MDAQQPMNQLEEKIELQINHIPERRIESPEVGPP